MRGQFVIDPGTPQEQVVPNIVVQEGEESFLKMLAQADVADVSVGGNFFFGLCNYVPLFDDVLSDVLLEPSSAGGYARQAITRDATGFPTISLVNGVFRARTANITWTASGADFDQAFTRLFLCNVSSGTAGILYSVSGALVAPITLLDGNSHVAQYELFLNG